MLFFMIFGPLWEVPGKDKTIKKQKETHAFFNNFLFTSDLQKSDKTQGFYFIQALSARMDDSTGLI